MKKIIYLLTIIASVFSFEIFASDNPKVSELKEEVKSSQYGPKMAITAFNKDDGFKMSDKALTKLKVKFAKLNSGSSWTIPEEALVRIKQSTGVYRRLDGWITFVLVKVSQRSSGVIKITSDDLQESDEVAITGSTYLRMADADLNSETVDSCAH